MRIIVGCNFERAYPNMVMGEQCQNLNSSECCGLLTLLRKLEYLFDGTLGMWKTTPVDSVLVALSSTEGKRSSV